MKILCCYCQQLEMWKQNIVSLISKAIIAITAILA